LKLTCLKTLRTLNIPQGKREGGKRKRIPRKEGKRKGKKRRTTAKVDAGDDPVFETMTISQKKK